MNEDNAGCKCCPHTDTETVDWCITDDRPCIPDSGCEEFSLSGFCDYMTERELCKRCKAKT